ncbi:MAG: sigma 54-interacting transcriptional regulator [Desulfovibrionaceae bacterium]|nr:sigma 54-interacting transcriptional regulator [Desulfovibrionaceae bacterium]
MANMNLTFEDRMDYLETLRDIAAAMGPRHAFQASLRLLLETLAARHGFLRPHLVIFDPETATLRLCVAEEAAVSTNAVYRPGMGVTGQVFSSGKPVVIERLKDSPEFLGKFFRRTEDELDTLSFISVPVLTPNPEPDTDGDTRRVIGVLSVDTQRASVQELKAQRLFLEVVAGLIAARAAYLQESMRQTHAVEDYLSGAVPHSLTAYSPVMKTLMRCAEQMAGTRLPLFLTGTQGCGKGYLAVWIHEKSGRGGMDPVRYKVPDLGKVADPAGFDIKIERELFGYRKGSFPGAERTHKGLIELANCSTLIIEDIDRLSKRLQERLLVCMREQQVLRAGGGEPVAIDVRFLFSSQMSGHELIDEGFLIDDLSQMLMEHCLECPALSERREDIIPLAEQILTQIATENGESVKRLSENLGRIFQNYDWPENIHEMSHCLRVAVNNSGDALELTQEHLPYELKKNEVSCGPRRSFGDAVEAFEKQLLEDALQRSHGNMLQAARDLQASYRIVNYKVKKYGLDLRCFQDPELKR